MTSIELLREALKDPILRSKYGISEEEIQSISFDTKSDHLIIEIIKTVIKLKEVNNSDNNVYKQIKSIHMGIKE
jgi:hypothetical protein